MKKLIVFLGLLLVSVQLNAGLVFQPELLALREKSLEKINKEIDENGSKLTEEDANRILRTIDIFMPRGRGMFGSDSPSPKQEEWDIVVKLAKCVGGKFPDSKIGYFYIALLEDETQK